MPHLGGKRNARASLKLDNMTNFQLARSLPASNDKPEPRRRPELDRLRVLVAAEDACRRWTLCGWLACLGATLRQVDSSADALDALADAVRFDLVIADLTARMPDGTWLVATMRALGIDTPCVLFDGHGRAAHRPLLGHTLIVAAPRTLEALAIEAARALTLPR
ncbi:MAG: hypothetical protein JWM53_1148 [bacterium]|nr:hypothetical protein [bacterium]